MKLLITGSGGYIGSIATRTFLRAGHEVIGIDSCSRGYQQPQELLQREFGEKKFRHYKADISTQIESIFNLEPNIDAVVHFAAFCNVGESESHPQMYFENNTGGVSTLLEAMQKASIKKLVFSSTCAVYGDPQYVPIDEEHPVDVCTSPYGESKKMAEQVINWYEKLFDFKVVTLRYFNICGAADDGVLGDSKRPSFHLMQNAIRASLGLDKFSLNYTKVDTPDGSPIRDYINVEDLAEAHVKAVDFIERENHSELFNLGTGTGNSVFEIVSMVEKITNTTFDKSVGARRKGDAVTAVADNRKAKTVLDWQPKRSIEDSINSLRKWYTNNPEGWEY